MHSRPLKTSATTKIILPVAIACLLWYAAFLFSPVHIGNPVAYSLLVLAECIGMSQLLSMWMTIMFARLPDASSDAAHLEQSLTAAGAPMPSVALLITVAGEPIDIIRQTATAVRDVELAHRTFILDDGSSDAVKALAHELQVEYIRRPTREGKKAGNINYALAHIDTEYFAIFDSDHVPRREFLAATLPFLLQHDNIAFVQTPQSYSNTQTFIAGGSAEIQEVFYRHVQTGKNAFNAAFCVGTNVLFRRAAVDDIGGMYQQSNSEDIWTSLLLHEEGWDSLFLPTVLATGHAPETVDAYFRQQFRWSRGGFEIFFTHNPLLSRTLTIDQKLQYLSTITHYFSSISILIFFLLPLLYVYFGIKPLEAPEGAATWAVHFIPYFLIIILSTSHLLGRVPSWRGLVIASASFPSHIMAMLSVITNLDLRWSVTGEIRRSTDYIQSVVPQLLLLLLSLGAIPLIFLQQNTNWGLSLFMAFWLSWNSALLFSLCKRALPILDRRSSVIFAKDPVSQLST